MNSKTRRLALLLAWLLLTGMVVASAVVLGLTVSQAKGAATTTTTVAPTTTATVAQASVTTAPAPTTTVTAVSDEISGNLMVPR